MPMQSRRTFVGPERSRIKELTFEAGEGEDQGKNHERMQIGLIDSLQHGKIKTYKKQLEEAEPRLPPVSTCPSSGRSRVTCSRVLQCCRVQRAGSGQGSCPWPLRFRRTPVKNITTTTKDHKKLLLSHCVET